MSKQSSVILVFNNKGEFALQLRSSKDSSYPLHWDFSAAGGIEQDEYHFSAARRELQEELGISGDLKFVGEFLYIDDQEQERLFIYKIQYNGRFFPDPKEVEKVEFFTLDEIGKMIKDGDKFHPEFIYLWNKNLIK